MCDTSCKRDPEKRFAVALFVSALVHAALSGSVTQGISSRSPSILATAPVVRVRLVLVPHEPQAPDVPPVTDETPRRPQINGAPERRSADTAPIAGAEIGPVTSDRGFEASDPTYYAARELDVYPALATALESHVPRTGAATEARGRVLLMVHIGATGTVDAVSVMEAEPAGYFEEDARRTFQSALFRPALKNGRPVKSRILVQLEYGNSVAASQ